TCWSRPGSPATSGRSPGMLVAMEIPRLRTTCSRSGRSRPISIWTGTRWISSLPRRTGAGRGPAVVDTRSVWGRIRSRSCRAGWRVGGGGSGDQLGAPGDDVQRRAHLVRDARGELSGHRQRLRAAELLLEVERVLALGDQSLPRLLEALRHAVERLGQLP